MELMRPVFSAGGASPCWPEEHLSTAVVVLATDMAEALLCLPISLFLATPRHFSSVNTRAGGTKATLVLCRKSMESA